MAENHKRAYLPFESARTYVDRGMLKWIGFFISEHTNALNQVTTNDTLQSLQTILYIVQLAFHQQLNVYIRYYNQIKTGWINEIIQSTLYLKTDSSFYPISINFIHQIFILKKEDENAL